MNKQEFESVKAKTFTYNEVYDIVNIVLKKQKIKKYVTLFILSMWASALTFVLLVKTESSFSFLLGGLITTFLCYVTDETFEVIYNYYASRQRK